MQKRRYVYLRPYVRKGTQKTELLITSLTWEQLQFEHRFVRCYELCFYMGNVDGKRSCVLGYDMNDVCAFFFAPNAELNMKAESV